MYEAHSLDAEFIPSAKILERVSQIDIMERYLGIEVRFNRSYKSPFRADKSAGCRFYVKNNKLRFIDFSKGFNEDCFGVVQYLNGCNFNEAIILIAKEFSITTVSPKRIDIIKQQSESLKEIEHSFLYDLSLNEDGTAKWREEDKEYWRLHNVTSKELKDSNVYPLRNLFMDGDIIFSHRLQDIGFIYLFKDETFKAYFPLRRKGDIKFITNSSCLQGYDELPEQGDILVITKAMKDVVCLKVFNINSVAPQSENTVISDELLDDLESRFKIIITLFDFDIVGVKAANRLYKQRGYEYFFFTNGKFNTKGYRAKDFSEYLKKNGKEKTLELIKEVYNNLIDL